MRKRSLGVVLLAGLAMSGAGAFTASNTFNGVESNVAGYGASTVTGANVTDISYQHMATDSSKLANVRFVTDTDVTTKTATLALAGTAGITDSNDGPYSCTITGLDGSGGTISLSAILAGTTTVTSWAIDCPTTANPNVADVTSVALTVLD